MSNDSVKKLHLNDKGFIAFDVIPEKKYKWMMHESQEWFDKAKKIQGPDWHWNNAKPVEYVFDSFGFRNDKELFNLQCWALTAEAFLHISEWKWIFKKFNFKGDQEFIFFE